MREIIWQVKAKRQVKKIKDSQTRVDILDAVESLAYFPTVANVKALVKNRCTHRLKVGKYRVLFNAFERINITSIEEVKKRNERTYK
jgi:mRNA-degrading endonuclease RelE of RelBE toxin-antitoxin system